MLYIIAEQTLLDEGSNRIGVFGKVKLLDKILR